MVGTGGTSPEAATARRLFTDFVHRHPAGHHVALHDCDADGLAAAVLWRAILARAGFSDLQLILPDRERNAWTATNRERVHRAQPDVLYVLDLGSQSKTVIRGVPTCFIDHHRPEGVPPGDTLISAYLWDPIPCTSLLMYDLGQALVKVDDLDWIAALGAISDLGEKAPFSLVQEARKRYTAKYLKEAVALLNAPRRASHYRPEVALKVLLEHPGPRALVLSETPEVADLRAARVEVKAALTEAKKAAPKFSGKVSLISIHSTCQVHPLIAQIWRTRLPKYLVMVANYGFSPGRVHFSVRGPAGCNVLDFLSQFSVPGDENSYGHGHDGASGGNLSLHNWYSLLQQMGFPDGREGEEESGKLTGINQESDNG